MISLSTHTKLEFRMDNRNNTTCANIELSLGESEFLETYTWWVEMFGNLFIAIVGVILNFITIGVLSTSTMRNNFFNRLLICLASFDNSYLFCEISEVLRLWHYTYTQQHVFAKFVYPIRSVFLCSSIYMTIALTLERYQAIACPVQYRLRGNYNKTKRLLTYVMPVLVISIFYYSPKFLDLKVIEVQDCNPGNLNTNDSTVNDGESSPTNCTIEYHLSPTELRTNHHYVLWYINISNLLLTACIPIGILMYLNCKIYFSLNKFIQRQPSTSGELESIGSRRRQQMVDVKKTFILFSIVAVFVLCHSLRFMLNVDEFLNLTTFIEEQEKGCDNPKFWDQVLVPLNQILIIINASAHFFIYVFFDYGFQRVLKHIFIIKSEIQSHKVTLGSPTGTTRVLPSSPGNNNITENVELALINNNGSA